MDPNPDLALLERTELFRGVPAPVLRVAASAASRRRVAAGETVFRQGDASAMLYVVLVGRLCASQTTADGQQVIIRYLGPGEVAGYAVLSGTDCYPGSVTAVDDTHLLCWNRSAITAIMREHSAVAMNAVALIGARYHEMQLRLRELSTERVEQRLAHTILRLATQAGRRTANGIEIAFPLSRQDLSEMAGTTLHTVSRTLSAWEEQGVVRSGRRRVIIAAPDTLAAIAEAAK
jgi:CRP-like cAMP-binding protein